MAQAELAIEIATGQWAINVIKFNNDKVYDLVSPKNARTVTGLPVGHDILMFVNVAAPKGTEFKVTINGAVIVKGKTDKDNLWTGAGWFYLEDEQ